MPIRPARKILVVLVTRNRPARAVEAYKAWLENSAVSTDSDSQRTHSDFMVAYDNDDRSYAQQFFPAARMSCMKPGLLGPALNMRAVLHCNDYVAICNIGDDHLIRTPNWDKIMLDRLDAIGGHGVLYPDDMIHHEGLATAVVMSSELIKALGWMALPNCNHMYIDNAWMDIGRGIGKLEYVPEVVMEHMHPSVGKATMDEMYQRAVAEFPHDAKGIEEWRKSGGSQFDIQRVKTHLASLR